MSAYYNEIDPFAAQWIRELIKAGMVAEGEVDERSITKVGASDLRGFTQCHFFAGIAVWSYALRLAGWPDDRPVWTGSCPCPSFSAAGKGEGFNDPRHLWPAWFKLIRECRPATVFGEQVNAAIGHGWLDLVQTDLEAEAYAVGAVVFGAHSVGAPHIRQRLYFVAQSMSAGWAKRRTITGDRPIAGGIKPSGVAESECSQLRDAGRGSLESETAGVQGEDRKRKRIWDDTGQHSSLGGVAEPEHAERRSQYEIDQDAYWGNGLGRSCEAGELGDSSGEGLPQRKRYGRVQREALESSEGQAIERRSDSFWSDAEWLWCRDGKYRPVEPGTFPLAHGAPARVGRLRGYGNSIVAPQAQAFIEAYLETLTSRAG